MAEGERIPLTLEERVIQVERELSELRAHRDAQNAHVEAQSAALVAIGRKVQQMAAAFAQEAAPEPSGSQVATAQRPRHVSDQDAHFLGITEDRRFGPLPPDPVLRDIPPRDPLDTESDAAWLDRQHAMGNILADPTGRLGAPLPPDAVFRAPPSPPARVGLGPNELQPAPPRIDEHGHEIVERVIPPRVRAARPRPPRR